MRWTVVLCLFAVVVATACTPTTVGSASPIERYRQAATASTDGETVGRWLLAETIAVGGTAKGATRARKRLDELEPRAHGPFASLARGIDDEAHGRFDSAATAFIDAVDAARTSSSPDAPLIGWYAANQLLRLRVSVTGLYARAQPVIEKAIAEPGNLGWRARGELVEWWAVDGLEAARRRGEKLSGTPLELSAEQFGCVSNAKLAGPFGDLSPTDHRLSYAAERPGVWPVSFPGSPRRTMAPRVYDAKSIGCTLRPDGAVQRGIYYAQTFVELDEPRDVTIAAQGALSVWVDDHAVLQRDPMIWGIWPRFGVRVRLREGRHRILVKVAAPETSIRLMTATGLPLAAPTSADDRASYDLVEPKVLADPNVLTPFTTALGVASPPGPKVTVAGVSDPLRRFIAAYLAHVDGQDDVASVLMEPLIRRPSTATGSSLGMAAVYLETDPIFPSGEARDLATDLREHAAERDPGLWWPRLWLALDRADREGLAGAVGDIEALANAFPEVPDILLGLSRIYARLGWDAQRSRAIELASERFPDDPEALRLLLNQVDRQGRPARADEIVAHLIELNPSDDVRLARALARQDYQVAAEELKRIGGLDGDEEALEARMADLLRRAGAPVNEEQAAGSNDAMDAAALLDRADAELANALLDPKADADGGDANTPAAHADALRGALAEAIEKGAETEELRLAVELVEGSTPFAAHRRDGAAVIAEYERSGAAERQEGDDVGTAARVLDYAVLWVSRDGSARMLEHEILQMRSREAIAEHAEQRIPNGLMLKVRTVKRDGTIYEPEFVSGKPTLTMPHLEVGDYIETEIIYTLRGDGSGGRTFRGPRWYFREEKIGYWWSEFAVVTPSAQELQIETTGDVPPAEVTRNDAFVTHRWRVDNSPALPEEPGSAPLAEFLPSVRVGWGIDLDVTLDRMVAAAEEMTPLDPRLRRTAEAIAIATDTLPNGNAPKTSKERQRVIKKIAPDERARRIYRWVLENIDTDEEADPRRTVTGKSGQRAEAFRYLCRLVGVDVDFAVARSRLAPEPDGPIEAAESFDQLLLRVRTPKEDTWLVVRDQFAPYGFVPDALRGQPAVILRKTESKGLAHETVPDRGIKSGIAYSGTGELRADGSALLQLRQAFRGQLAIGLRSALDALPPDRLKDAIEGRLLPQALPGARLRDIEVLNLDELDKPLVLKMEVEVASFAVPSVGASGRRELRLSPPFLIHLGRLASLSTRQTPLYLSEAVATFSEVKIAVTLPSGASVKGGLANGEASSGPWRVSVSDRQERQSPSSEAAGGAVLIFERTVDLPPGRVQPTEYAGFARFAREAEELTHRPATIVLE